MCNLINRTDLKRMRTAELRTLFNRVGCELLRTQPGTSERRDILACLDIVRAELRERAIIGRP